MQSERPLHSGSSWSRPSIGRAGSDAMSPMTDESPVVMSATAGPLDQTDFYWRGMHGTPSPQEGLATPPALPTNAIQQQQQNHHHQPQFHNLRSASHSPSPARLHGQSSYGSMNAHSPPLTTMRSTPILLPSRPAGSVKNIANRIDQTDADATYSSHSTGRTGHERRRKPVSGSSRSSPRRSPTRDAGARTGKRRPDQTRMPTKSSSTSFETSNSSFSSANTVANTPIRGYDYSHEQIRKYSSSSSAAAKPAAHMRPLFGEITSDGQWNGNFDLGLYEALPPIRTDEQRTRPSSNTRGRGRSHSQQDISRSRLFAPPTLSHRRSRSDMSAWGTSSQTSMQTFTGQDPAIMFIPQTPTRPPPPLPTADLQQAVPKSPPSSRIPVSNHKFSDLPSPSQARSTSALSNRSGRSRIPQSPVRKPAVGKENASPSSSHRRRYDAPAVATPRDGQTLSAKIVAPPPQKSPPLRSSRPRQPVSSATTAASRARAAERFEGQPKDGRRPSEQWLGKPYDPLQERSKRKIPQLGPIDFAERRARIQKAISQNLEESQSLESLRSRSRSRQSSRTSEKNASPSIGGLTPPQDVIDQGSQPPVPPLPQQPQHQPTIVSTQTTTVPGMWPSPIIGRPRGLSIDTSHVSGGVAVEPAPTTAHTVFEDESPILGRGMEERRSIGSVPPVLLSSKAYQPPSAIKLGPVPFSPVQEPEAAQERNATLFQEMIRNRRPSPLVNNGSDTQPVGEDTGLNSSASEAADPWGLSRTIGEKGSIKIMLEDERPDLQRPHLPAPELDNSFNYVQNQSHTDDAARETGSYQHDFDANGYTESPVGEQAVSHDEQILATPRNNSTDKRATVDSQDVQPTPIPDPPTGDDEESQGSIARLLHEYRSTGILSPKMLDQVQKQMVDLNRASANGASNGFMIQSLLDSVANVGVVLGTDLHRPNEEGESFSLDTTDTSGYDLPQVTPDTPPGWRPDEMTGTATVFRPDSLYESTPIQDSIGEDDDDFAAKIRKADEAWERQQRGVEKTYDSAAALGSAPGGRLSPTPRDFGTRSSISLTNVTSDNFSDGLRISGAGSWDTSEIDTPAIQSARNSVHVDSTVRASLSTPALVQTGPPQPSNAPPVPPAPVTSPTHLPYGMMDKPQIPASVLDNGASPRLPKTAYAHSGSSRPSIDSQRPPTLMAGSISVSSLGESTRQTSIDTGGDGIGRAQKSTSPNPEQKRLLKRRHIIRELLDTENSYHQDLKIIEDIYRATATPDLVSAEDKKVLFGNCDDVERFSLHFYDELRKSSTSIYVPAKSNRWLNKRSSYSTTQSDGTGPNSAGAETVDNDKDRATTIGQAFIQNLPSMEQVYTAYLKNHDAANRRLVALRNTQTVKCWLDECHNNASDITAAWDLDSLLVKPTQRVAKYPMLLQQLLESTPQNHPDREALSSAAKDSVAMLTRINEAKKRADLVDQIVNGKGKDTDVRSGIAKAFGRRTDKLKERVGMAEAFQDPDFDELAHKFGGHFIRLQICMRDVQDYMHRMEKAMDQINNYAAALDMFTDLSISSMTEIQSKWRKYGQSIREVTAVAFADHKAAVNKRVIGPMITCIKLHDGPQNAIGKRKKRIVDYAKCKSLEKRGEKPDKRTIEAAELYEALNEQLKLDLPRLYSLTAKVVQGCLNCFLSIQLVWYNAWERKLRPILELADIPKSISEIEPAFRPDWELVKTRTLLLGICNGAFLAESAKHISFAGIIHSDYPESSSGKASFSYEGSRRTLSMGSDNSPMPTLATYKRRSSGYANGSTGGGGGGGGEPLPMATDTRMRSASSLSQRNGGAPILPSSSSGMHMNRPWSNGPTPGSSYATSRPDTGTAPSSSQQHLSYSGGYMSPRRSMDQSNHSPRPASSSTYFTAQPGGNYGGNGGINNSHQQDSSNMRFSGIFSSAMPLPDTPVLRGPSSTNSTSNNNTPQPSPQPNTFTAGSGTGAVQQQAPANMPVLFVCASLFEFSIDKTRREAGYPYLTYVQGEVFDVVAQKGELWLAKNQDDDDNLLGWIWEQHFVILSQN